MSRFRPGHRILLGVPRRAADGHRTPVPDVPAVFPRVRVPCDGSGGGDGHPERGRGTGVLAVVDPQSGSGHRDRVRGQHGTETDRHAGHARSAIHLVISGAGAACVATADCTFRGEKLFSVRSTRTLRKPTEFAANVDLLEDVAVDTGLKDFLESRFGRYVDKEKMYL